MPPGAIIGTSSLRREVCLKTHFPQLKIESLRGNLDTRLSKLDAGHYDGIVLAAAGLKRLGLEKRIREILPADICLPSAGQGALAIEICAHRPELQAWLNVLNDEQTHWAISAERTVLRQMGGTCHMAAAAFGQYQANGNLHLRALIANDAQGPIVHAEHSAPVCNETQACALGHRVTQALLAQGAQVLS